MQMSCLSRQTGLHALAAAQRQRHNALHHMMGQTLQQGWPWHFPCRAPRRWPTVWLLLIGASVSPWRQSVAAGVTAVTLPAADGSSPDWSYTLPAAPQRKRVAVRHGRQRCSSTRQPVCSGRAERRLRAAVGRAGDLAVRGRAAGRRDLHCGPVGRVLPDVRAGERTAVRDCAGAATRRCTAARRRAGAR
jgi:hypothetical protein